MDGSTRYVLYNVAPPPQHAGSSLIRTAPTHRRYQPVACTYVSLHCIRGLPRQPVPQKPSFASHDFHPQRSCCIPLIHDHHLSPFPPLLASSSSSSSSSSASFFSSPTCSFEPLHPLPQPHPAAVPVTYHRPPATRPVRPLLVATPRTLPRQRLAVSLPTPRRPSPVGKRRSRREKGDRGTEKRGAESALPSPPSTASGMPPPLAALLEVAPASHDPRDVSTALKVALAARDLAHPDHTQQVTLGVIAAYAVGIAILWNVPYLRMILWPFKARSTRDPCVLPKSSNETARANAHFLRCSSLPSTNSATPSPPS